MVKPSGKGHKETEGLEDVLYLDGGGYMGVYTFITTQSYTLRFIHFIVHKFYL